MEFRPKLAQLLPPLGAPPPRPPGASRPRPAATLPAPPTLRWCAATVDWESRTLHPRLAPPIHLASDFDGETPRQQTARRKRLRESVLEPGDSSLSYLENAAVRPATRLLYVLRVRSLLMWSTTHASSWTTDVELGTILTIMVGMLFLKGRGGEPAHLPLLARLVLRRALRERLRARTMANELDLLSLAVKRLCLEPPRPSRYGLKHGGVSHDLVTKVRSEDQAKRRGRWRTDTPRRRYAEETRLLSELSKIPALVIEYGAFVMANILPILYGSLPPGPPPVGPR